MITRNLGLLTLLVASVASRLPAQDDAQGARAAFERFKALAGTWYFRNAEQDGRITYEIVSGGTAVLERVMAAESGPAGMVSVIRVDGDRLVMDHFCTAANQPRLVSGGLIGNEVRFVFAGATNLASEAAGHIHAATFRFSNEEPFISAWTWREGGVETTSVRRHRRA